MEISNGVRPQYCLFLQEPCTGATGTPFDDLEDAKGMALEFYRACIRKSFSAAGEAQTQESRKKLLKDCQAWISGWSQDRKAYDIFVWRPGMEDLEEIGFCYTGR